MAKYIKLTIYPLMLIATFALGAFATQIQTIDEKNIALVDTLIVTEEEYSKEGLSVEELEFLEKYLFGRWYFAERIFETNEFRAPYIFIPRANISDEGVGQIVGSLGISFGNDRAAPLMSMANMVITDPRDMYILGR